MATLAESYNQAVSAFEQGALDQALSLFSRIQPQHGPFYPRSLGYIGRILVQKGDSARAEEYFKSSARQLLDPDTVFQLGELYFNAGRSREAETAYRKVIEIDPKFTDAYIRLGMLLRDRAMLPEAIRNFELAILNDQRAVVARYFLAQLCLEKGDDKRALSQLHFVLKIEPAYDPARLLMADVFQRLGDHRQALVEFCEVVNRGSRDSSVFARMAKSFQAIGDRPQAVKAFEQAFGLNRGLYAAAALAAQMREEMGHYERALGLYRQLVPSGEYRQQAQEAIERLERMFAQYNLTDRPQRQEEASDWGFEAPPVQQTSGTEPFLNTTGFNTSDLSARKPIQTAPIRFEGLPVEEPTAVEGFLKGMMDTVLRHVPAETRDVVKQRLEDIDALRQKIDLDSIKRRFGR